MSAPAPTICPECEGLRFVPAEYTSGGTLTVFAWPCPVCCCGICGQITDTPPECSACAIDQETAAKRAADQ